MPRASLIALGLSLAVAAVLAAGPGDPHLDASTVPGGCQGCHTGHGASGSSMLPATQGRTCLGCHGEEEAASAGASSRVGPGVRPTRIGRRQAYAHPLDGESFSRADGVTCTSCHSPHRGIPERRRHADPDGRKRLSPRNARELEHELCAACHGAEGGATRGAVDVVRRLSPGNASFHPVEAPSPNGSRSIRPPLAGREINCTDCHGNNDRSRSAGPHQSDVKHVLRDWYEVDDGSGEAPQTYALCYGCHARESILRGESFSGHARHLEDVKASCATCHDPHGAFENRALIRFGQDSTAGTPVTPSQKAGILAFMSDRPGSGSCYLTCHGKDHSPATYGPGPTSSPASIRLSAGKPNPLPGPPPTGFPRERDRGPGVPRARNPEDQH